MSIKEQLTNQNFAEVEFGAEDRAIQAAFDAYDGLLTLPLDYRSAGDYQINDRTTGSFGYFRRVEGSDLNGRTEAADTKHVYHLGANSRQAFESAGLRKLPLEVREFCDRSEVIYWLGVESLRKTLDDLHDELDLRTQADASKLTPDFLDPTALLNVHLRLLAYETPTDGQTIARGHYDRSVFTLALAETEPGLEIGTNSDAFDLIPVQHTGGIAKFFAGKGWERMPDEYQQTYDFLHPAYHRVVNGELPMQLGRPIIRRALVLFANSLQHNTDPLPEETRPERLLVAA